MASLPIAVAQWGGRLPDAAAWLALGAGTATVLAAQAAPAPEAGAAHAIEFSGPEIAVVTGLLTAVTAAVGILWQRYTAAAERMLTETIKQRDASHAEVKAVLETRIAALVERLRGAEELGAEERAFSRTLAASQVELLRTVVNDNRAQIASAEDRLAALTEVITGLQRRSQAWWEESAKVHTAQLQALSRLQPRDAGDGTRDRPDRHGAAS